MNGDSTDLEGLVKSHVGPSLTAVSRLIDAVAPRDAVARIGFTGADPDDIRVGLANGDIADGDGRLLVELVFEVGTVIDGFEQPTRCGGGPPGAWVLLINGECRDSAAHVCWSDRTPRNLIRPFLGQTLCKCR